MDEHFDVLIVGAGLSGIGAACHLQRRLPGATYAILEAREAIGGTWDLFRYPGVRSDSDMFTLGYSFRPWTAPRAIAAGAEIRDYIRATAREHDVERRIRFGHRVLRAAWDSRTARWTVECNRGCGERAVLSCRFLHFCSGYYSYEAGYTPSFPGVERFAGPIVHPQQWPADLDWSGKQVIVIGSGATAITLAPALAERAAHVVMLQRSPSYVVSLPRESALARALFNRVPPLVASQLLRLESIATTALTFQLSRRRPALAKRLLLAALARELPPGYDVERHFTPRYNPWDQRLCVVADGDLFAAIRAGTASVATGRIESFTPAGIRLDSGEELEADLIVTATGLALELLGGAEVVVDGVTVDPGSRVAYKGAMLSGVPNAALSFGYTNASWTLKCDLICEFACRLLAYLDRHGYDYAAPLAPDAGQRLEPLLEFTSGYVTRAADGLPRQGERAPWRLHQNWFADRRLLLRGELQDEGIRFGRAGEQVDWRSPVAAIFRPVRLPQQIRSRVPDAVRDNTALRALALAAGLIPPRPMHSAPEGELLRRLARETDARRVVEIGVYEGSSAVVLCAALAAGAELHLIDPFIDEQGTSLNFGWRANPTATRLAVRRAARSGGPSVHWHVARSQEVGRRWRSGEIDVLFIDGDHSYEACREDWQVWHPHIRVGGVIAFHDARGPRGSAGPTRVVAELFRERPAWEWGIVEEVDRMVVVRRAA